jgi:predicted Fe-S protein YdhL (DUF1289 family)
MHKEKAGTLMHERSECLSVPVPTPCINVCRLDEVSGLCLGCARNGAEIAAWAEADAGFKRTVWEALPSRRARLGMSVYRLPWTAAEIGAFVEASLRKRSGRWRLGAYGASISFAIEAGEAVEIAGTPDAVTAVTPRGALRLLKHEKTIAIAFGDAAHDAGPRAIGLVLPRGRVALHEGARLDEAAICEAHRHHRLLLLAAEAGIATRFYVRSPDGGLPDERQNGDSASAFADAERALQDADTQAVVETGLGRVEIFAPDDRGDGPAFHLSASRFVEARELPPGWPLDRVFALGALYYPKRLTSGTS